MRLSTNLNSLNIYRNQKDNLRTNSESLNRLVSGKKLSAAKDNPNKVGQSNEMQIKIRSLEAANKNVQDTNSMIQSVDGSIAAISDSLIRMKELAVKGANGSHTEDDLKTIQNEIDSIKDGIDSIVSASSFNGKYLIGDKSVLDNESPNVVNIMVGAQSNDKIELKVYNFSTEFLIDDRGNSIKDISVMDKNNTGNSIHTIDESIAFVNRVRGEYGAIQSRLEGSAEYLTENTNLTERAVSKITDADLAKEMLDFSRTAILSDASMNIMAQSNNFPKEVINILQRIK